MDPFTHTFAGGLMASSGLRKVTPLATAALVIGANLPDIDILVSFMGEYSSLAHRRGWTHGVLAWVVLPVLLAGSLLLCSQAIRVRNSSSRFPKAKGANFWPLLAVSALAVLSHPLLDWLNNYGIRLLMPFDSRWFYGDTLFIVDPWVWLMLGGSWFLVTSQTRYQQLAWLLFWIASSAVIISNSYSSTSVVVIWFVGLAFIVGLRSIRLPASKEVIARGGLGLAVIYVALNAFASHQAKSMLQANLHQQGEPVIDTMVGPAPANPLKGNVVAVYPAYYRLGNWDWTARPKVDWREKTLPRNMNDPTVQAAARSKAAQHFLIWSRFPYAIIKTTPDNGYRVEFKDARYTDGGLGGPTVILGPNLRVLKNKKE